MANTSGRGEGAGQAVDVMAESHPEGRREVTQKESGSNAGSGSRTNSPKK